MSNATAADRVATPPTAHAVKARLALPEHVKVWEHTNSVFWWPMVLLPPVLWGLLSLGWISDSAAAWWFIGTLAISMLAVSVNLSLLMSVLVLVVVFAAWISILFAELKWKLFLFDWIGAFLGSLDIHYNVALGNIVAFVAGLLLFWSIMHARFEGRWHFRQNDFEHFRAMASDGSKARAGKTIRAQYRDLLKLVLGFGGGNIVILSGTVGDRVEVEISNVFFLAHRWKVIQKLISSTRTNQMDEIAAAAQADDQ